jgi:hypothetical protein
VNKTAMAAPFSSVGGSTAVSVRESERLLEPSDFRVCRQSGNVLQSASAEQYAGLPFLAGRHLEREKESTSSSAVHTIASVLDRQPDTHAIKLLARRRTTPLV